MLALSNPSTSFCETRPVSQRISAVNEEYSRSQERFPGSWSTNGKNAVKAQSLLSNLETRELPRREVERPSTPRNDIAFALPQLLDDGMVAAHIALHGVNAHLVGLVSTNSSSLHYSESCFRRRDGLID